MMQMLWLLFVFVYLFFFYNIEKNRLFTYIIAFCSFLLGTKTAILAIILYLFIYHFINSKIKTKNTL